MKKTFKFTAKKVEDAISNGLSALGVSMDEAEVNILSTGGLFKKAEVEIVIEDGKEEPAAPIVQVQEPAAPPAPPKPAAEPLRPKAEADSQPAAKKAKESRAETEKPAEAAPKKSLFKKAVAGDVPAASEASVKKFEKRERGDRIPATEETARKAEAFLKKTLSLAGIDAAVTSDISDGLKLVLETEDSAVIGHRGEVLDALQYLASLIINNGAKGYVVVSLDALGYRGRRAESLRNLAARMADKCVQSSRRVGLEPMNSADRKEIHAYLSEIPGVVTKSEGFEPNRRIIIYPERRS